MKSFRPALFFLPALFFSSCAQFPVTGNDDPVETVVENPVAEYRY
jgi:hypothetical protein